MKNEPLGNASLEFALDKYPLEVSLKDGLECFIRPLQSRDTTRLHKFLLEVPELERLFIKERVMEKECIHDWCAHIDHDKNVTLLMLHGNTVIGEANLHLRQGGWKRHVGLLTTLTHKDYKDRNVSMKLIDAMVEVARYLGLMKLEAELNGERHVAIRAMELAGFGEYARVPNHVLDMQGQLHDYVVMGIKLTTDEEYASAG